MKMRARVYDDNGIPHMIEFELEDESVLAALRGPDRTLSVSFSLDDKLATA